MNVIINNPLKRTGYLVNYCLSSWNLNTAEARRLKLKQHHSCIWRIKEIQSALSTLKRNPGKLKVEKEMEDFKSTLGGQCLCLEDLVQVERSSTSF